MAPDIGVLASTDLVAIEVASLEIFERKVGRSLREKTYPGLDPWIQIRHAEKLGLGSREYELAEVENSVRRKP